MKRLQGPISPCFFGDHLDVECLEQRLMSTGGLAYEEELEDTKMPFLQMLQSVELSSSSSSSSSFWPLKEPSFQTLLMLQHLKKQQPHLEEEWLFSSSNGGYNSNNMNNNIIMPCCEMETRIQAQEFESYVTHDNIVVELHGDAPIKCEAKDPCLQYPILVSTSECNQEEERRRRQQQQISKEEGNNSKSILVQPDHEAAATFKQTQNPKSVPTTRERRKRKRTRPTKNKEEVETQRMTHVAIERNRRRQMNDHLNVLRSLMPTSYIQRGDQASIVGGAIDFVKELEQLLESLEAQKRMRKEKENNNNNNNNHQVSSSSSSSSSSSLAAAKPSSSNGLFMSLSRIGHEEDTNNNNNGVGEEVRADNKLEAADIEVTVIQTHVNLKIQCPRRPGQLLKAIVALENLRLSILHLNITSLFATVLYAFNLKIEDGCKLETADEIAGAVNQIFRFMDGS